MKKNLHHLFGAAKAFFLVCFVFLIFPFAKLCLHKKQIWLISERPLEARDNGYIFYKYLKKEHSNINSYYAIDPNSSDYTKISNLGGYIKFGSLKHLWFFCGAKYIISSTTQGFCPNYYLTLLRKKMHLWGKYIFLQHGITKDNQTFLYKDKTKIDLFICGAEPEYLDIKAKYGYEENEVVYTGFSRFDTYYGLTPKRQILVMPTWRRTASEDILNSEYYKKWMEFLNNNQINDLLVQNNVDLYFYVHPLYQQYSDLFSSTSGKIKIASIKEFDMQQLIRDSLMLVTDFSSLAFDFGYMGRPVIYYQYDEKEYFETHYEKGYFDYRRDGFGPVCNTLDDVISNIKSTILLGFLNNKIYSDKIDCFFKLKDSNNCKRIFEQIKTL